jgi:hypothetical protein
MGAGQNPGDVSTGAFSANICRGVLWLSTFEVQICFLKLSRYLTAQLCKAETINKQ